MSNILTSQLQDLFQYSKEITQKTELKAIDLKNDYIAVNQKDFVNGDLKSEIEYVTSKNNAKKILFIRNQINEKVISVENMPNMYDRKILEVLRNELIYKVEFNQYIINNPYSYLKSSEDKDMKDVILLNINIPEKIVKDIYGNIIPVAMYFDAFVHNITDEYYNIKDVGAILQLRKDIKFQYFNKTNNSIFRKEISFENNKKHPVTSIVPFIWTPNNNDFKRYIDFYHNSLDMEGYKQEFVNAESYIINEILGLMSAKNN